MRLMRCAITACLCALAAGCGASNPATELSPSSVTPTMPPLSSATTPTLTAQSIGSCPDGNAPTWLQTWTKAGTARLRWTEVAPEIEYHVVVERYDVTNRFMPVDNGDLFVVNQTWAEVTVPEGRYRAKIQTRACGRAMGPWSDELIFSVEGNEPPPSPPASETSPSGESAEGTKVPSAASITDASGDVWTLGAEVNTPHGIGREVLRNGSAVEGVFANEMKYHNHSLYLHGPSGNWFQSSGTDWINVGPTEP